MFYTKNYYYKISNRFEIFIDRTIFIYKKYYKVLYGDIAHVIIRFNGSFIKIHVITIGYNCPEIRDKDPGKKKDEKEAKEIFCSLVLNKIITLECLNFDRYG